MKGVTEHREAAATCATINMSPARESLPSSLPGGPSEPPVVTIAISDATACVQPVDAHLGAEDSSVQTQADQAASVWCCQSVC